MAAAQGQGHLDVDGGWGVLEALTSLLPGPPASHQDLGLLRVPGTSVLQSSASQIPSHAEVTGRGVEGGSLWKQRLTQAGWSLDLTFHMSPEVHPPILCPLNSSWGLAPTTSLQRVLAQPLKGRPDHASLAPGLCHQGACALQTQPGRGRPGALHAWPSWAGERLLLRI